MAILDVIIPTYNNKMGLHKSLMSIGPMEEVAVTIIDDCSSPEINYDDIINYFSQFFNIRVLKTKENGGPGAARQFGLDHTFNELITFLDCGDVFYSTQSVPLMIDSLLSNAELNFCSFAHYDNNADFLDLNYTAPYHNRIHGKIYRRAFLKRYGIKFCKENEASRANEDICFNILCRMISANENRENCVGFNDFGAVIWESDPASISRKEDCAFYYREQNMGLAKNFEHILHIAKKNKVRDEIIHNEIYNVFSSIHTFYLSTKTRRPEYLNESFKGALYFYKHCFKTIEEVNWDVLRTYSYNTICDCLRDETDPLYDNFCSLNILDFINELEEALNKEEKE